MIISWLFCLLQFTRLGLGGGDPETKAPAPTLRHCTPTLLHANTCTLTSVWSPCTLTPTPHVLAHNCVHSRAHKCTLMAGLGQEAEPDWGRKDWGRRQSRTRCASCPTLGPESRRDPTETVLTARIKGQRPGQTAETSAPASFRGQAVGADSSWSHGVLGPTWAGACGWRSFAGGSWFRKATQPEMTTRGSHWHGKSATSRAGKSALPGIPRPRHWGRSRAPASVGPAVSPDDAPGRSSCGVHGGRKGLT